MIYKKDEVVLRKLKALEQNQYKIEQALPAWETRGGWFRGEGRYEDIDECWETISIGYLWTCQDDYTRWFRCEYRVTEEMADKPLMLELDFGGEGIVRINGEIVSAVTSYLDKRNSMRTRVCLCDRAAEGKVFQIEAEIHTNYMEYHDFRMQGANEIEYRVRDARVVCVDPIIESYYFDVLNLYEAMQALKNPAAILTQCQTRIPDEIAALFENIGKDTYYSEKLEKILSTSLSYVDFDFEKEKLSESIPRAAEYLKNALDDLPYSVHACVHFIGQAHIDTAWLWPIYESERKTAQTFSNVCDLMERYPEFTFAFSQPALFELLKEYYPELYEKVRKFILDGRIEIVGNTWVEMDTNIPSGESLVRQLLYGRQFFLSEFGKASDVFWMPDVFGYSWALPQIISRSGMKYFYTSKLINNDDNRFPYSLFKWQGIDGTRVTAYLQRLNYNGNLCADTLERIYNRFDQKSVTENLFMTFGYGDGGGGPNYQMLEKYQRLKAFPGLPKAEMSTANNFFVKTDAVREELPIWNDEMYYEFHRGTYTSQAHNKRSNRKNEILYRNTEMLRVYVLKSLGMEYPYNALLKGYRHLLTNQFHDILPGSAIHSVYENARKDYCFIEENAVSLKNEAIDAIASQISSDGRSICVFNYLSWERSGEVCVKISADDPITVYDAFNKRIPSVYNHDTKTLCFYANCVPPLGYACYSLRNEDIAQEKRVSVTARRMENHFYRIELDENGFFDSIYDKVHQREVLSGKGNVLKIFEDKPGRETAWNIDPEYQNKFWCLNECEEITAAAENSVKGILRIRRRYHKSEFTQEIVLYADSPRIDIETSVDWHEKEKMLKAEFPVDVLSSKATYEIQFGAIERTTHENTSFDRTRFEVPAQKWADLSEGKYGVSLLNDCKYGYDIRGNVMRITLLRAPIDPDPTADMGKHEFMYSLYPHTGDWIDAGTVKCGYEVNIPLEGVYIEKAQKGTLPEEYSALSCDCDNVIIDTVKAAENGEGIIVRMYETSGTKTEVTISTGFDLTLVRECNLMEEDERELAFADRRIPCKLHPFEIKTIRLL